MKKMPLVIAFICGVLALMVVEQAGILIGDKGSGTLSSDNASTEATVIEHSMSASDAKMFANIKDTSLKILSSNDYEFKEDVALQVTRLVNCVNQENEFDHKIYSYNQNGKRCLIVVCHGWSDGKNDYGALMHGKWRRDYVQATEESLAYWARKGNLRNAPFDFVILSTCYSGYASQENNMPIFDIKLYMANNNKDVNAYREEIGENGRGILHLYRGIPKSSKSSYSNFAVSSMIGETTNFADKPALSKDELKDIHILGFSQIR